MNWPKVERYMILIHLFFLFTFKIIQSYDKIFYEKISSAVTLSVRATTQNSKNRSEELSLSHMSPLNSCLFCVRVSGCYNKMMMVTMEIPTTFHPQMEKISDSIGSTTGSSTTTTIITQISNNHQTTTFTSSSSNRIIINLYLVLILVLTLFLANFDLNLVMISDVFLASMPT